MKVANIMSRFKGFSEPPFKSDAKCAKKRKKKSNSNLGIRRALGLLTGLVMLSAAPAAYANASIPSPGVTVNNAPHHYIDHTVADAVILSDAVAQSQSENDFHLFSHGRPGELLIDGQWQGVEGIVDFINQQNSDFSSLNIYGCNFAKGAKGKQAVLALQNSLGVSVAASDNITGKDGDWELEVGQTTAALSVPQYAHSLQDTDDDGVLDDDDLDDDNDGILDTVEKGCSGEFDAYWFSNDPAGTKDGVIVDNSILGSVAAFTFGVGLSPTASGADWDITGVNEATYAAAVADDDYVEYAFTTQSSGPFPTEKVLVERFGFLDSGQGGAHYYGIAISDDGFASTSTTLITGVYNDGDETGSGYNLIISSNLDADYELVASTTYTIRVYIYGAATAGTTVVYDDFQFGTCVPLDTDADGIPDYLDTDSDNDGCPDATEGADNLTTTATLLDGSNGGSSDNLGTTVDADGVPIVAAGGQATTPAVTDAGDSSACDCTDPAGTDTDNDGINDICDLDDDNDGILDVVEKGCSNEFDAGWFSNDPAGTKNQDGYWPDPASDPSGSTIVYGGAHDNSIVGSASAFTFGGGLSTNLSGNKWEITGVNEATYAAAVVANDYVEYTFTTPSLGTFPAGEVLVERLGFADSDTGGTHYYGVAISNDAFLTTSTTLITSVYNDANAAGGYEYIVSSNLEPSYELAASTTYTIRVYIYGATTSGTTVLYDDFQFGTCVPLDTDGDGFPDYQDTDSDDDGCPDAIEGAGTFTAADLDANLSLTGAVDADGVPIVAAGGQATTSAVTDAADNAACYDPCTDPAGTDTDNDNINDICDLDDDNDGILDTVECIEVLDPATFVQETATENTVTGTLADPLGGTANFVIVADSPGIDYSGLSDNNELSIIYRKPGPVEAYDVTTTLTLTNAPSNLQMALYGFADAVVISGISTDWVARFGTYWISWVGGEPGATATIYDPASQIYGGTQSIANVGSFTQNYGYYNNLLEWYVIFPVGATEFTIYAEGGVSYEGFRFSAGFTGCFDTDGDGIPDPLDLDSDNDGISDLVESGADFATLDPDNNGVIDEAQFVDADGDGLADAIETTNGDDTGTTPTSTDTDGTPDYLDLDSDGDGIPDTVEAYPTSDNPVYANDDDVTDDDTDGDGVIDQFDGVAGHAGNLPLPEDTDGDGTPDYLDTDSDNDGLTDNTEGGSTVTDVTYADPDGSVNDDPTTTLPNQAGDTTEVAYREAPGNITGTIWLDVDGDGVQDIGEPGIAGVTVALLDSSGNPVLDSGGIAITAVTDANGDYNLPDLPPGDYQVQVDETDPQLSGLDGSPGNVSGNSGVISLAPGETEEPDFGYVPVADTGVVEGTVWSDADADGIQDPGEVGIEGVTVALLDSSGNPVLDSNNNPITAVTGPDGSYLLTGVPEGEYVAVVDTSTVPADYTGTTPTTSDPFTVLPNEVVSDVNFGFDNPAGTSSYSDAVFNDEDGDGIQDAGEEGVGGVTVDIYEDTNGDGVIDPDEPLIGSVTTNPDGTFSFDGLPSGNGEDYIVSISDNDGVLNGHTETTVTGGTVPVTDLNGDVDNTTDPSFGYNQPNSISGTIFSDASNDGVFDTNEMGIPVDGSGDPIIVELQDGTCTPGSDCPTTTVNPDGTYDFTAVPEGTYTVVVTNPPAGTNTTSNGTGQSVTVTNGESVPDVDFGYNDPSLTDITGTVFNDVDTDGTYEPDGNDGTTGTTDDESGIGAVTLTLSPTYAIIDGGLDVNGDGVIDANDDGIVDGNQDGSPVTVIDGQLDINGDGVIDTNDDGSYNGIDVIDGQLDTNGDGSIDATDVGEIVGDPVATTTSDPLDGTYSFDGVPDGNYVVSVTDTNNVVDGYELTSGLDQVPVTADGSSVDPIDFGYVDEEQTAAISTGVWIDSDGDGIRDPGEMPVSGVDITLTDLGPDGVLGGGDDVVIATATTDADGNVIFPDLPPGNYVLDVDETDLPAGVTEIGTYGGNDPNDPISLSEGESFNADFAVEPAAGTGVLSGSLWSDANDDGLLTGSEVGLGDIEVTVTQYVVAYDGLLDVNGDGVSDAGDDQTGLVFAGATVDIIDGVVYVAGSTTELFTGTLAGQTVTNGLVGDGTTHVTTTLIVNETTVTTNPDGTYLATGLQPGNYFVTYDTTDGDFPSGLDTEVPTNTGDVNNDGTNDNVITGITLAADTTVEDLNFGFYGDPSDTGTVNGSVYFEPQDTLTAADMDANDSGIESVTVNLVDSAGNVIATAETSDGFTDVDGDGVIDPAGFYSFTGVPVGTGYTVVVTDTNNATIGLNPTENPSGTSPTVSVTAGGTVEADFGYAGEQNLGNIGNLIWLDIDNDGVFDPTNDGDTGIAGVTVECWVDVDKNKTLLIDGVDNLIRTVVTDVNGEYYCKGVPTGGYLVRVTDEQGALAGYVNATVKGGTGAATDADNQNRMGILPTGGTAAYWLSTASDNLTGDFAVTSILTLSGIVYDESSDGSSPNSNFDGSNVGVGGVPVTLYKIEADGTYTALQTVTSAADGSYSFDSVPSGVPIAVIPDPSGTAVNGFDETENAGGVEYASGITVNTEADFGFFKLVPTAVTIGKVDLEAVPVAALEVYGDLLGGIDLDPDGDGMVAVLRWDTLEERGTIGFYVQRAAENGEWVLVNDDMMPGQINAPMGGEYMLIDPAARSGETYQYLLIEQEADGNTRQYGPFTVEME